LIAVTPKLGATVKQWTRDEILEAYHIRRVLEREAVRLFVMRATPQDKQRLVELTQAFDVFAATDPVKALEGDIALHLHNVRATRCPRLYELVETSRIETTVIFGLAVARPDSQEEIDRSYQLSSGCHVPLVEALLGDNPDAADVEICRQLDTDYELMLKVKNNQAEPSEMAWFARPGA